MDVTQIMFIAASVLVLVAVITIAFSLKSSGSQMAASYSEKVADASNAINNASYAKYDNKNVSGADVINAIRQYSDEMLIQVETFKSATETNKMAFQSGSHFTLLDSSYQGATCLTEYSATVSRASDVSSGLYINPNATFAAKVLSEKSMIYGLQFTQKDYVDSAVAWNGNSGIIGGGTGSGSGSGGVSSGNAGLEVAIATLNQNLIALQGTVNSLSESVANLGTNSGGSSGGDNTPSETPGAGIDDTALTTILDKLQQIQDSISQSSSNPSSPGDSNSQGTSLSLSQDDKDAIITGVRKALFGDRDDQDIQAIWDACTAMNKLSTIIGSNEVGHETGMVKSLLELKEAGRANKEQLEILEALLDNEEGTGIVSQLADMQAQLEVIKAYVDTQNTPEVEGGSSESSSESSSE